MLLLSAALTDWTKALSLNTLCGKVSENMGNLGVVHWDSANKATTTCLSYSWTYDPTSTAVAMRCYYCSGKASGGSATANMVYFDAFVSPVTVSRKVSNFDIMTVDNAGAAKIVFAALLTDTLLTVKAVTACTGPTSLK
jgi:hypothetical protein